MSANGLSCQLIFVFNCFFILIFVSGMPMSKAPRFLYSWNMIPLVLQIIYHKTNMFNHRKSVFKLTFTIEGCKWKQICRLIIFVCVLACSGGITKLSPLNPVYIFLSVVLLGVDHHYSCPPLNERCFAFFDTCDDLLFNIPG